MVLNAFKSGIFSFKPIEGTSNLGMLVRIAKVSDRSGLQILTSKQMLE